MTVAVDRFGKDHWSTFAYLETLAVDNKGRPDIRRMRCDIDRHPGLMYYTYYPDLDKKHPTRLADGEELPDHDDWDCVDDLEAAGFVEQGGTGIHPVFKLTDLGHEVAAALRKHKAQGGNFAGFAWQSKVTIGDVLFRDIAPLVPGPPRGRRLDVIGDARVVLLRAFYQGHLLGDLEAFALGRGTIDRTDVDWDSAGEEITG